MIRLFRVSNFRCLEKVEIEFGPRFNLVHGDNASGKTSLLEALAYLGRGKSFRGATTSNLVRHGNAEFVLYGEIGETGGGHRLGVRNSKDGLEVRVDGEAASGAAPLAQALPLQVIDPEVHNLIAGGPELRRRYLDWIAFHVEHDHLECWRRFRRALKQRNAALKAKASIATIQSWDTEFLQQAMLLTDSRKRALDVTQDSLREHGETLLETELTFDYRQGWSTDRALKEALVDGLERDLQLGSSQHGPHRADIKISYDEKQARKLVSRGQQKLLASAMILAATEIALTALEQPLLLLLDDPAAELDSSSIERLMLAVAQLGCQVVATSLESNELLFPEAPRMFHVEQGRIEAD